MGPFDATHVATWSIAALAVLGIIIRPRNLAEAWWAVAGALALVTFSLVSVAAALAAIAKGLDVYLFLIGMMVLAEMARREGLFDWLAFYALRHARRSASRLFLLIYGVGTVVTIFLSNDATAVVLTPAVYAAARRARVAALPYLFICAFIANAASFVLPISNPANLVVFGEHMPNLWSWLTQFGVASIISIGLTYCLLRLTQNAVLRTQVAPAGDVPALASGGRIAAIAIGLTAVVLLIASTLGWQLGLPTCVAGLAAWLLTGMLKRRPDWRLFRGISWSILPLVAGLFVLVQGVADTGALTPLVRWGAAHAHAAPALTAMVAGSLVAVGSNLINNLPAALIAATAGHAIAAPGPLIGSVLIGVDLGPNLSVTGSLATILWLVAIRREGEDVRAARFLLIGSVVMPLPLLASLGSFVAITVSGAHP